MPALPPTGAPLRASAWISESVGKGDCAAGVVSRHAISDRSTTMNNLDGMIVDATPGGGTQNALACHP